MGFLLYGRMIHFESYALSIKDDYALRNASVSYCNSHKENFYLIDMNSISIFLGSNGLWSEQELGNTISLGGWHVFSPLYYEKLKNYNIKNLEQDFISRDNVYLIIRDTVAEETLDNYLDYYAGKGIYVIPELVDSFSTTQGRVCEVYSFSKNVME